MKLTDLNATQTLESAMETIALTYTPQKDVVLNRIQAALIEGKEVSGKAIDELSLAEVQDRIVARYREVVAETKLTDVEFPYTVAHRVLVAELQVKLTSYSPTAPHSWTDKTELEVARKFIAYPNMVEWLSTDKNI